MTYKGRVEGGMVVLIGGAPLAERTVVRVKPIGPPASTLGDRLMEHAGMAKGLPADMAENRGHYLHAQRRT